MKYTVGIDLGTTHTVVAFAEHGKASAGVQVFDVPQLTSATEQQALPLLPSFLYAPAESENLADPFGDAPFTIGSYARRRGQEVPARLVASAKSWLGHAAVDRRAAILPWGSDAGEVPKVSPVEASRRLLEHVRRAWDERFPGAPLREQRLVLTVPASFDEAGRELTVEAAEQAGLHVRLLEEPQAAFYDYLTSAGTSGLESLLSEGRERALVLVCDVGGGTTDLTLIEVREGAGGSVELERVAVGRHLLLGGDNIDLALAHELEARLVPPPGRLEPARFNQLTLACRAAKERLLSSDAPEALPISVAGTGSALVGATLSTRLTRAEVEATVLDGFLPHVARDAKPERTRAGLLAFGLPYERDPAITRHVAAFFARQTSARAPDALLLNGGLFRAPRAAERLREVVSSWGERPPSLLPHPDPDLAVARGAVGFGLALDGRGPRIGGGTPQGFYAAVDVKGERRALCVVPRGAREGERHTAEVPGLSLRVGAPVRFELFTLDTPERHRPGDVVALDPERFVALPPVSTVFEAGADSSTRREISVGLEGELSAIGTVDLACVELGALDPAAARRFRLAFDLRDTRGSQAPESRRSRAPAPSVRPDDTRLAAASDAIDRVFGKSRADVKAREAKDLLRELERLLGEKRGWTADLNRALFDQIIVHQAARRRSEDHERTFWMLAGYCLRPGFGHPADKARVGKLVPLFETVGSLPESARVWQQFFIAWRRIAAGLEEPRQVKIRQALDPFLAPAELKLKKPKWKPQAPEELLELCSWLERVPAADRAKLGGWLLERTWTSRDPRLWAALGRLGARTPTYASVHHVIATRVAEEWLDHLLRERWHEVPTAPRAAMLLARVTGDRSRDVNEPLRLEVRKRLEAADAPLEWVRAVTEHVALDEGERALWFTEELPVGLRLDAAD
jgi:molecular chaperone DnaK (HSP70)